MKLIILCIPQKYISFDGYVFTMDELRACLVQADLAWENRTQNLQLLYDLVHKSASADLIILPEMFSSGFTMKPAKNANTMTGEAVNWMHQLAKERNAAVMGSLVIAEGGKYFNRLFFVQPDETQYTYDKRHLFTLAGEEKVYARGNTRIVIDYEGWRIMPQVCYDLRFPVWCRNDLNYDLICFVANWPERRSYPWRQLLRARAIENQAYCIGVNRVGYDGNGIYHRGDSAAIDALGEYISNIKPGEPGTEVVTLKKEHVVQTRSRFGFLKDRDEFEIK
jgi:omega-amidase